VTAPSRRPYPVAYFLPILVVAVVVTYTGSTQGVYFTGCAVNGTCGAAVQGLEYSFAGVGIWLVAFAVEKRTFLRNRPSISGILLGTLFLSVFLSLFPLFPVGNTANLIFASTFLLGAPIYGYLYWKRGLAQKCPSCLKWYGATLVNRELLDSKDRWETVYDTVQTHTTSYDRNGSPRTSTSTSTVPRTAVVTHQQHLNYLRCRYCDHDWTATSTSRIVH